MTIENAYIEYRLEMERVCMKMLRNRQQCEDIVQDTFTKALASWTPDQKERTPQETRGWLFRIMTNTVIDYLRKEKLHIQLFSYHKDDDIAVSEALTDATLTRITLEQVFATLPEGQQRALTGALTGAEGEVIAEREGCSLEAIKGRLYRARKTLREAC